MQGWAKPHQKAGCLEKDVIGFLLWRAEDHACWLHGSIPNRSGCRWAIENTTVGMTFDFQDVEIGDTPADAMAKPLGEVIYAHFVQHLSKKKIRASEATCFLGGIPNADSNLSIPSP